MKQYTCKKPCTIGGKRFVIGDIVPAELIAPEREQAIIGYGLVAVAELSEPNESSEQKGKPDSDESSGQANEDTQGADEPTEPGEKQPSNTSEPQSKSAKPSKKVNK